MHNLIPFEARLICIRQTHTSPNSLSVASFSLHHNIEHLTTTLTITCSALLVELSALDSTVLLVLFSETFSVLQYSIKYWRLMQRRQGVASPPPSHFCPN